jgi:hypothetical protein
LRAHAALLAKAAALREPFVCVRLILAHQQAVVRPQQLSAKR